MQRVRRVPIFYCNQLQTTVLSLTTIFIKFSMPDGVVRNAAGANQHGERGECGLISYALSVCTSNYISPIVKASDSRLKPALLEYHHRNITNAKKISEYLLKDHGIVLRHVTHLHFHFSILCTK
jgi:type III secretory pathway component EscR